MQVPGRRQPARRGEGGFTLIEVTVALVVFGIIAAALAALLITMLSTARNSHYRVVASNLASHELEIVRNRFTSPQQGAATIQTGSIVNPDPLPNGTAGTPEQHGDDSIIDGVHYTVTRTAEWQQTGASGPCDGARSNGLQTLRVGVTVSWPHQYGGGQVTSYTLLAPPLGTFETRCG